MRRLRGCGLDFHLEILQGSLVFACDEGEFTTRTDMELQTIDTVGTRGTQRSAQLHNELGGFQAFFIDLTFCGFHVGFRCEYERVQAPHFVVITGLCVFIGCFRVLPLQSLCFIFERIRRMCFHSATILLCFVRFFGAIAILCHCQPTVLCGAKCIHITRVSFQRLEVNPRSLQN